jgi:hypothetical protein
MVCQKATLLVAHPQQQFLVWQASSRKVRARTIPCHSKAGACDPEAYVKFLVEGARFLATAGPRTCTNGIHTTSQEAALPIAKASKELLIVLAHIAIMQIL